MRLLVILLFLLTPLRGVAAATLCIAAEHGGVMGCEAEMASMGEHAGAQASEYGAVPSPTQVVAADLTDGLASLLGCGSLGLCAATPSSIAATVATLPLERVIDAGPATSMPHLGPGIRPAPPIHPPKA